MSSYERDILLRENIQLKWSGIFQNICDRLIAKMSPIFYHFLYPYRWQCDLVPHFINGWNLSHAPLNLGQPHDCALANRRASKGRCAHSDPRPWRPHIFLLALFCPCHVKKPGISFSRRWNRDEPSQLKASSTSQSPANPGTWVNSTEISSAWHESPEPPSYSSAIINCCILSH